MSEETRSYNPEQLADMFGRLIFIVECGDANLAFVYPRGGEGESYYQALLLPRHDDFRTNQELARYVLAVDEDSVRANNINDLHEEVDRRGWYLTDLHERESFAILLYVSNQKVMQLMDITHPEQLLPIVNDKQKMIEFTGELCARAFTKLAENAASKSGADALETAAA